MRRLLTLFMCLAVLAAGVLGTFAYAHNYYLYRGFGPPSDPAGVAPGSLRTAHFFSPALGTQRSYRIYLPPGYAAAAARGARFPVLYLLHGSPGWPDLFINAGNAGVALDTLIAHHRVKPFIIVMPDGRNGTFRSDTEWANTSRGPYESFVLDVVHAVDKSWATKADRAHRAIAGNSAGAFGAVNVALHNLRSFGVVESWSGYYSQNPAGPFKGATVGSLQANSPLSYVGSLHGQINRRPLSAFLYSGRKDRDTRSLPAFAARLRAAGGTVTTAVYPGGHDWRLWRTQMPAALRYAGTHLAGP
jgi:enterochelin esterase-like enzyme